MCKPALLWVREFIVCHDTPIEAYNISNIDATMRNFRLSQFVASSRGTFDILVNSFKKGRILNDIRTLRLGDDGTDDWESEVAKSRYMQGIKDLASLDMPNLETFEIKIRLETPRQLFWEFIKSKAKTLKMLNLKTW
ncbi:unnamed protein product, partial [marine sediment metagenome]